jgi:Cft2 family RNA processing exonuclease
MSGPAILYKCGGIHLPGLGLWLDPSKGQKGEEPVFVSHAHSDHIAAHRQIIASAATARLMRERLPGERIELLQPFGVPLEGPGGSYRITLFPAGHVLGSAMAWIESEHGTLLYTGDFKTRPGLAVEPCQFRAAEYLIMETTFGRPAYRFPSSESVMAEIGDFCRDALSKGATPVLLAYSLGKCQELHMAMGREGLPIALHDKAHRITQIYEAFGWRFPDYELFSQKTGAGKVVIWPPSLSRDSRLKALGAIRTAMVTGWAIDRSCRYQFGVDAAFPLSDHADYEDLVSFVRRVNPRKVFTLHGFAADFAGALRTLGFDSQSLSQEEQLTLPL